MPNHLFHTRLKNRIKMKESHRRIHSDIFSTSSPMNRPLPTEPIHPLVENVEDFSDYDFDDLTADIVSDIAAGVNLRESAPILRELGCDSDLDLSTWLKKVGRRKEQIEFALSAITEPMHALTNALEALQEVDKILNSLIHLDPRSRRGHEAVADLIKSFGDEWKTFDEWLTLNRLEPLPEMTGIIAKGTKLVDKLESLYAPDGHHAARKQRWEKINSALGGSPTRSIPFSAIPLGKVESIFSTRDFTLPTASLDQHVADVLISYLYFLKQLFNLSEDLQSEREVLFFVTASIVCGCINIQGISMRAEQPIAGSKLRAHGRCDLVISKNKRIHCIVEAKRTSMKEGFAQAFVSCEVASERENAPLIKGIVANPVSWTFIRSEDTQTLISRLPASADHPADYVIVARTIRAFIDRD